MEKKDMMDFIYMCLTHNISPVNNAGFDELPDDVRSEMLFPAYNGDVEYYERLAENIPDEYYENELPEDYPNIEEYLVLAFN